MDSVLSVHGYRTGWRYHSEHIDVLMPPRRIRKYELPNHLAKTVEQRKYERWLHWRAVAHVKRDRKRGNPTATVKEYKEAIHRLVVDSNGLDPYTHESLDWSLIGTYDNAKAKARGREYKARYALMPSVDHQDDGLGPANFRICSWKSNDAKSDLSYPEFLNLCRMVIEVADSSHLRRGPSGNGGTRG